MSTTAPSVLFVCVHNAGRSQMAAAFLTHLTQGRVQVRSAGSTPAEAVNPAVVEAMKEVGIDISAEIPKVLTTEAVQASDVVITMGCGDTCPFFPGKRYLDWHLDDPAGQGVDAVRPIRDEIETRIRALITEILPPAGTETGTAAPRIVAMTPEHAAEVLAIYQLGIDEGQATFETTAPTWEQFDAAKLPNHRHVALDEAGRVLGWVAASPVSDRCVYSGVVEHSVYVHPDARNRGVGLALLHALIASTEQAGIWTIQSGIFPENSASLTLHARAGFRVVGTRERIGRHHGVWRDVTAIERRSPLIS
ncbi:GNAT family N-acetyltransferase [Sphaerisporangium fuscum]|uniref:GNAT family N-acetyltransferase n=1 Tax=Sphaerisporangium fuscum TaxID=2835868 RepID=UPI003556E4BB